MSQTPNQPSKPPITIEAKGDAVIARVDKKMLDDVELKSLAQLIDGACPEGKGVSNVVVDLTAVHLVPSLGLGVLVQIANKCKVRKQRLMLAGVQPQVRQVFAITKLDRMFDFKASVDEALE